MDSNKNSNNLIFNNTKIHEIEMITTTTTSTSTSTSTTTLNNQNIFLKYYWVIILIIIFIMIIFIICIPNICKCFDKMTNKIIDISINCRTNENENHDNYLVDDIHLEENVMESKNIEIFSKIETYNNDVCIICLEKFNEETISLPCNNLFHKNCIISWLKTNQYVHYVEQNIKYYEVF